MTEIISPEMQKAAEEAGSLVTHGVQNTTSEISAKLDRIIELLCRGFHLVEKP